MGYLTRAAFQRESGKSRAEVDRLLAAGMPHKVVGNGRGSEIRIERAEAMAWLADRALDGGRGKPAGSPQPPPEPEPDLPPWLEAIVELAPGPVEKGFCIALMSVLYQAPLLVATMAVRSGAGLSMAQVFALSEAVSARLLHQLFEDARRARVEPFASAGDEGPGIICPDAFLPVDWPRLAAAAGEPGWVPPRFSPIWPDLDGGEGDAAPA